MNSKPAYGHMVQNYYLHMVRSAAAERKKRLAGLKNRDDALAYVQEVRKKISDSFGELPEKTPLNAKITGVIDKGDYRIEKVIYESRPGFPVTALLYLPQNVQGKVPGVLGVCGHSATGKAENVYQTFCIALAQKGIAVLMYDPISQGERKQFLGVEGAENISGFCTREHNMMGKQLRLCGDFFGLWRAWDGIRGIDYLCSRPEIDASRIGVTGNSGGGTLTSYINALDNRPTMAAPSCFITTYLRNYLNELPTDSEQIPPGIIAAGCDMADFVIAQAPRPTIILGQKNDFFDSRGTAESYEEARLVYKLLGAEDNVKLGIGPDSHGYTLANRQSMYEFFCKHTGIEDDGKEPESLPVCEDAEISCTPDGEVDNLPENRRVTDFINEKAEQLASVRKSLDAGALKERFAHELQIEVPEVAPDFNIQRLACLQREGSDKNIFFNIFDFETEPGISCRLKHRADTPFFHLPEGEECILYVSHLDAKQELVDGIPEINDDATLFGFDVRGAGDSTPLTCDRGGKYFDPYGFDYFYASFGIMLDNPYLGGKVRDVLTALKVLKAGGYKRIKVAGRGIGSIVASIAALLSDDVDEITLINAPVSFMSMIRNCMVEWPLSHMIPGMLKWGDLPDLYRALDGKELRIINPWDALFREMTLDAIGAEAEAADLSPAIFSKIDIDDANATQINESSGGY